MDEIINHYNKFREEERLGDGLGRVEFERTREILKRFLPAPPAGILDVGGASGIYSAWLAFLGYETHLLDPVPRHLELARELSARQPNFPIASVASGDARSLPHPDALFDAVLVMGPLYHLTATQDRHTALSEALRVLKPGGILVAAGISRFASLLDGLSQGFLDDPDFATILQRDLVDGQHRNPTSKLEYFTTAFFHKPEQLHAEVADAGFEDTRILAVEGPAWVAVDIEQRWDNPDRRRQMLELLRALETEPSILGASPHLLAIARKPAAG